MKSQEWWMRWSRKCEFSLHSCKGSLKPNTCQLSLSFLSLSFFLRVVLWIGSLSPFSPGNIWNRSAGWLGLILPRLRHRHRKCSELHSSHLSSPSKCNPLNPLCCTYIFSSLLLFYSLTTNILEHCYNGSAPFHWDLDGDVCRYGPNMTASLSRSLSFFEVSLSPFIWSNLYWSIFSFLPNFWSITVWYQRTKLFSFI